MTNAVAVEPTPMECLHDLVEALEDISPSCDKAEFFRRFFENFGELIPAGTDDAKKVLSLFLGRYVASRYSLSHREAKSFLSACLSYITEYDRTPSDIVNVEMLWWDALIDARLLPPPVD